MKFSDVLPALEAGRRVRRAGWQKRELLALSSEHLVDENGRTWNGLSAYTPHLFADDWEVVPEEPAPVIGCNHCSTANEARATIARLERENASLRTEVLVVRKELASAERVRDAWKRDAFHWMEEAGAAK